jgi:hypothetical protein
MTVTLTWYYRVRTVSYSKDLILSHELIIIFTLLKQINFNFFFIKKKQIRGGHLQQKSSSCMQPVPAIEMGVAARAILL